MLYRISMLVVVLFIVRNVQGQKALRIGDTLPNMPIEATRKNAISFKNTRALKGKFLIIDFWNINCTSCLRAMPYMDSLQREFGEKLNILMVTSDSKPDVLKFYKTRAQIKMPSYSAMIVEDSALTASFPHNSVPHHIWIDDKGTIKYITDGHYATRTNVQSFLKGIPLNMRAKIEYEDFDIMQPLVKEGNGRLQNHLKYHSTFFERIPEYGSGAISYVFDTIANTTGVKLINQPILEHYKFAYSKEYGGTYYEANRIILAVKDERPFAKPQTTNEEWMDRNLFSYELSLPLILKNDIFRHMQEDLNRYLPYTAGIEQQLHSSLVLTQIDTEQPFKSRGGKSLYALNNDTLTINNYKIETLRSALAYSLSKYNCPVINAINYKGAIDIILSGDLSDLDNLNGQLKRYGLQVEKKVHNVNQLIIRDK